MAARDLDIANGLTVPGWTMTEVFKHAGGPGGQNVNKVETGVQLRFAYRSAALFTEAQLRRLERLAGSKATKDGEIIINAISKRTQEQNRADARDRLAALIDDALKPPPPKRKKTRPTRGSIERRLKAKSARGDVKKQRGKPEV